MAFLRRKPKKEEAEVNLQDLYVENPSSAEDFLKRAWVSHARGEHSDAERDLRKALDKKPDLMDAHYALGLVFKAQGRKEDAIKTFREALRLAERRMSEEPARDTMVRRLASGHISELTEGDWHLERTLPSS